jgi:hypothetical protein
MAAEISREGNIILVRYAVEVPPAEKYTSLLTAADITRGLIVPD